MHIFVPRTDKYTGKMQNNTKQRQQAILDILRSGAVYSQEELALRLKDEGIASTQATLSRDLRALRISKVPGEGYVIPTEGHSVFTDLSAGALRIQFSGNLAVIKTRPGLASAVASLIDHHMIYPVIGTIAGMPLADVVTAVNDGIGNTLKGIALLVGLGSMFGAILETSGGAQTLAVTMVRKFGDEKAAWALGITGLVIAMPVFFDAGLIILIPLAFSLAKRTNRSSLFYVIPLLAGLAVGHAFIPPTPGPVLVATMLGVDLGWVILIGIFCGTLAMIVAGPIWGRICGTKYMVPVPEHVQNQADIDESKLPKFGTIVTIILIPLVLIILKSLEPTGLILLVTACGGVLRYVLQYSGIGDVIGNAVGSAKLPIVVVAFIVAALVRICVGSATVAMTMAAGIVASLPGISALSPIYLACVVCAVAGGATVCSHFNDSGFWLVKSLVGLDEKTTLKTWTIMETLVGLTGFLVALVISFFVA